MDASIWEQILTRIETKVNRHSFYTWFKPTSFLADSGTSITVRVPNALFKDWLTKHYSIVLSEALAEVRRPETSLVFVAEGAPIPVAPLSEPGVQVTVPEPADGAAATALAGLNPRYTFDTFIVGPSNQFAHAASRAVAEAPSRSYNPLFIYGGVGLGKTHLMHAVGQYVLQHDAGLKLTYISSERFMNEMINAVRYDRVLDFRERYRTVDVLLVDDIQFLAGKEGTQTEFFHTFNALVDQNRQVVISADKSPSDLEGLEERLRSRLGWGLVADIHPTTYELRLGILGSKAEQAGAKVPQQVLEFLAHRITSNVRELEGALRKILAYSRFNHKEISIQLARDALRDLLSIQNRQISVENIQKTVADYYKIKVADMYSKKRPASIARPRQIAMYLAKELTQKSLPEIGELFGGRDHTTVLHAVRKISAERQQMSDLNQQLHVLEQTLKG